MCDWCVPTVECCGTDITATRRKRCIYFQFSMCVRGCHIRPMVSVYSLQKWMS